MHKKDEAKSVTHDLQALRENIGAEHRSRLGAQILALVTIFVLVIGAGFWVLRGSGYGSATGRTIFIHNDGFTTENMGTDVWIAEATGQALNAYLDAGEFVHMVGSDRLKRNKTQASILTNYGGAMWRVGGKITPSPDDVDILNLTLTLTPVKSGKTYSAQLSGVKTGLDDLSSRASAQIYTWLGRSALSTQQRSFAQAEFPDDPVARSLYAEGFEAMRAYDTRLAVNLFEQALEIGGEHPMVYNGLGRAWSHLGYRAKSRQAVQRAFETRENLSRERQLEIEAYYRVSQDQNERAVEVYRALKEFYPNDLSYRLAIVALYMRSSDMDGVQTALDDMRTLPAPFKDDPRIDLAETRYWHQKGDYAKGRMNAKRAAQKARTSGDKAVLAEALLNTGGTEDPESVAHFLEAKTLYEELNNPDKLAGVLLKLGNHERAEGRLVPAENYIEQAIEISRQVGNEPRIVFAQNTLSIVMDLKGQLSDGLALKQQVLEYYKERDVQSRYSIMLENIGISLFKLGRLEEAELSFDQALEVFVKIDDTIGVAWAPYHRSRIQSRLGNLEAAMGLAEDALRNAVDRPEGHLEMNTQFEVGQILFHQGQYDQAKTVFSDLETGFKEAAITVSSAEASHMLARIALRQGDYDLARAKLERARKIYVDGGTKYYEFEAQITAVDLAFFKFRDEIESTCVNLKALAKGSQYKAIALRADVRLARCATQGIFAFEAKTLRTAKNLRLFEPQFDWHVMRAQTVLAQGVGPRSAEYSKYVQYFATTQNWSLQGLFPVP